jgi:hypothetical protein
MTRGESGTSERGGVSANWWTPRRTRLAGSGGLIAGLVGLVRLGFVGVSTSRTGIGIELGGDALSALHPVGYVVFAVTLFAANARYGTGYGRRGRTIAVSFGLSLVSYAGTVVVLVAGRAAFGELLLPVGVLTGAAYVVIRLLGSLYGVVLWRRASTSRLTAGSFIILFPAIFVLGPLTAVGFPGVWIEAPLYLAFIALGYDLRTVETDVAGTENEVTG